MHLKDQKEPLAAAPALREPLPLLPTLGRPPSWGGGCLLGSVAGVRCCRLWLPEGGVL